MVVVDPRLTVTASKADRWLAIRPGTDMALGLALIHHILDQGLHDRQFCDAWVLGWERWRDFILAAGYTPDWAEPITTIPADEIRRLAEEMAGADGCVIFASRGINQHTTSVQTNRMLHVSRRDHRQLGPHGRRLLQHGRGRSHRAERAGRPARQITKSR